MCVFGYAPVCAMLTRHRREVKEKTPIHKARLRLLMKTRSSAYPHADETERERLYYDELELVSLSDVKRV